MIIDIPTFSDIRILVAGDVMLDRYWHGDTGRISPEAPVPVVRVEGEEQRPGGAANVALNIAALGGKATLVGVAGDDEPGRTLENILQKAGVSCHIRHLDNAPTITKLRIISRHQQLLRIDFEEAIPQRSSEALLDVCRKQIAEADLLVLSDYNKGSIKHFKELIALAKTHDKPVLIDPKSKDFEPYRGATLLTPNMAEFEAVVGACEDQDEIVVKGEELMQEYHLEALLITRGEQGMTLLKKGCKPHHMPTHAQEVFDVTGAGDTVVSVFAAALAAGLIMPVAAHLSNVAAGLVVGKLGTATISYDELKGALLEQHAEKQGVVTEEELLELRRRAQQRDETVVMTNGVFDILHAGHVTYLDQASRLGDRLIVAINVDETVRALKGEDRPVNSLKDRMTMLASLSCVDWVVAFSEETPERLICNLKPDYLVKGGDNDPAKIPGAKCVQEEGGEVLVMDYVDGVSTTGIIRNIRTK
jgi:D-beta-D-heptose 7-phosphate kinase/D-beta-D-heptose 1-phosphate adenosyltransferase